LKVSIVIPVFNEIEFIASDGTTAWFPGSHPAVADPAL
jgi:hypothetical protein